MSDVNPELPVDESFMTVSPRGGTHVSECYSPQHDMVNCMPGAFKGLCQLIQTESPQIAAEDLGITEEEMTTAVEAIAFMLSNSAFDSQYQTYEKALEASGWNKCTWQAQTWVYKNLGDIMMRIWWKLMSMRINDYKKYEDRSINEAAKAAISTLEGDQKSA